VDATITAAAGWGDLMSSPLEWRSVGLRPEEWAAIDRAIEELDSLKDRPASYVIRVAVRRMLGRRMDVAGSHGDAHSFGGSPTRSGGRG